MASKKTPAKYKRLAQTGKHQVSFDGNVYRVDGQTFDRWQQTRSKHGKGKTE